MKVKGKYDSILVAKYMVAYANANDIDINITKLNKLLYALYGIYIAMVGIRLTNEQPQAWPFGPVFARVREDFLAHDGYEGISLNDPMFEEVKKDDKLTACLKAVMEYYGQYSASALVDWSNKKKSAWSKATKDEFFAWGDPINDIDIQNYFKPLCSWKHD